MIWCSGDKSDCGYERDNPEANFECYALIIKEKESGEDSTFAGNNEKGAVLDAPGDMENE